MQDFKSDSLSKVYMTALEKAVNGWMIEDIFELSTTYAALCHLEKA